MMLFTEAYAVQVNLQPLNKSSNQKAMIDTEAPGFTAKDIAIKATPHALSIQGELRSKALAGYRTLSSSRAHKQRIDRKNVSKQD